MKIIHAQEQALVFEKFMNEDAYQIGTKIKQGVEKLGHDVVDSISLGDEQLFYYAIQSIAPSTSADLAERSAQPTMFRQSSYLVGLEMAASGDTVCRFRSGTCKVRRCRRLLPD